MKIWKAMYCCDIYECPYSVISIHRTERGAKQAIKKHKRETKQEMGNIDGQEWRVEEDTLLGHITNKRSSTFKSMKTPLLLLIFISLQIYSCQQRSEAVRFSTDTVYANGTRFRRIAPPAKVDYCKERGHAFNDKMYTKNYGPEVKGGYNIYHMDYKEVTKMHFTAQTYIVDAKDYSFKNSCKDL